MEQFLAWVESTGLSIWVRESGSIWSYAMIITFHSYGMAMLAGLNAVIDLRLLGFGARVPLEPMKKIFPIIRVGFWISLASGILLTIGDAATMLVSPVFYIKMGFIVLALGTAMVIKRRVFGGADLVAAGASSAYRGLALLSLFFWLGAITAGRLTAYLGPSVAQNALKGIPH